MIQCANKVFGNELSDHIIQVIKDADIQKLSYFVKGDSFGMRIQVDAYPLTNVLLIGDTIAKQTTEGVLREYTGAIAVDIRRPDELVFNAEGIAVVESYIEGMYFITEIESALNNDGFNEFSVGLENSLLIVFGEKIYSEESRDNVTFNRAILPFTITTSELGADC
ncbi:MAG: hypothetical protein GY928_34040 [Colwellia sp.]|nr:hypothetical protein [Colwellia sp.]